MQIKNKIAIGLASVALVVTQVAQAGLVWQTPTVLPKGDTSFMTLSAGQTDVANWNVAGPVTTYGGETWAADNLGGVTVNGITLSYSVTGWSGSGPHFYTSDTPLFQYAPYKDYGAGYGLIPSIDLTGLDSSKTYLIQYLMADNRADNNYTTTIKGRGAFTGINSAAEEYFFTDGRFTVFSAVLSGSTSLSVSSGQLWNPDNSLTATKEQINAIRVVAIPEPGSLTLLGLVGGALLLRRKLRRG